MHHRQTDAADLPAEPHRAARRDASSALVLGIASLVICAPVTAPFAFWLARRAWRVEPSGKAVAAGALATLGLGSSVVLWLLAIWQFLSPAPRH